MTTTATASRTHPVGPHLVIASEDTAAALTPVLTGLPPIAGALLVLAAAPDAAPVLRRALPDLVALARERGATRLVLAASGLAAPGPDGGRPVRTVATAAAFTVIAPDGVVSVEPDGTLRLAEPGTWWLAGPGEEPYELGAGWPPEEPTEAAEETDTGEETEERGEESGTEEPGTEEPGSEEAGTEEPEWVEAPPPPAPPVPVVAVSQGGAHGFEATPTPTPTPTRESGERGQPGEPAGEATERCRPVPGGVWLGGLPDVVEPLIGVAPDTFLVGVGSPAHPTLPTPELLDRVPQDAAGERHLLLAAPWAEPSDLVAMAVALADRLDRTVRTAIGLPVRTADDHATTYLDDRGAPTWQPPLLELAASPEHHRVVPSAWLRPSGPEETAPALYACPGAEGWVLELVPSGVWLRPADPVHDARPRTLRPDPSLPLLIVGDGERPVDPGLRRVLPDVLAALPDLGATEPYGLLVHGDASDEDPPRSWADALDLRWLGCTGSHPAEPDPPMREAPEPRMQPAPEARVQEAHVTPPPPVTPRTAATPPTPATPPTQATTTPAPVIPPASVVPSPIPGGRSGPDDRAALRELLGEKYHILASKAELLASRLPSLRSLAQEGLKPDMVAIALYQADAPDPGSRAGLAEAARAPVPGPFTPLLRCLESGLRRLPGHYGAVMLAAPAERVPLDRYVPGAVLVEPAAVATVPACDVELEGTVEFGIWSTTGRRTSVFAGTDDEPEVVFPPGTAFSVLALHLSEDDTDATAPIRVLLREISPAESEGPDDRSRKRDEQARTRLTDWFERRDMLQPTDRRPLPNPARFHVAPGASLD
ncbi:hypothetical protein ACGFYZ_23695 [Streptomyces sp. NPDC048330]|uniref:hypothetical protein n=1 Tax=Streptomyces sp. NPDC048330 TaxID=3365533 RepID=UPI0037229600